MKKKTQYTWVKYKDKCRVKDKKKKRDNKNETVENNGNFTLRYCVVSKAFGTRSHRNPKKRTETAHWSDDVTTRGSQRPWSLANELYFGQIGNSKTLVLCFKFLCFRERSKAFLGKIFRVLCSKWFVFVCAVMVSKWKNCGFFVLVFENKKKK